MNKKQLLVNPEEVENFVRSRIQDKRIINREQQFEKQLKAEIQNACDHFEHQIAKDIKIKEIKNKNIQKDSDWRANLKEKIQAKLQKSQQKKDKEFKEKIDYIKKDRKYKNQLFTERLRQIKLAERKQSLNKLKSYNLKQSIYSQNSNKLASNPSFMKEEVERQRKKNQEAQIFYQRQMQMAKDRKVFEKPKLQQHKLSLSEIVPRESVYNKKQKQNLDKLGQHLIRIQKGCKKREKIMEDRIKRTRSMQAYNKNIQKEKLKELRKQEQLKKKQIINKLSQTGINDSNLFRNKSMKIKSSLGMNNPIYQEYNQTQDADQNKLNSQYRKEIRYKVNQYLSEQRRKLSLSKKIN